MSCHLLTHPPRRLADVDWEGWSPHDRATLLFVIRGEEVLLIRKKRGLGAGKINAPGGRLEAGESPLACAVREVEEEVRVTPEDVRQLGRLRFQFVDGYALHVWVFRASDCRGQVAETDEALPFWTPLHRIPYEEMWADDRHWVPHLLAEQPFAGDFLFAGDALLDYRLRLTATP